MILPILLLLNLVNSQARNRSSSFQYGMRPTQLILENGQIFQEVFQQNINKTVYYKIQEIDLKNYLNYEINLKKLTNQNYSQMILFYGIDQPAHLDKAGRPVSISTDDNPLQQQKTYYHIILPPELVSLNKIFYFTMIIPNDTLYDYTLQITRSVSRPCSSNCTTTGGGGESDNTNILLVYFLVSVAVVLLLTWIILTLIRIKYQRQNRIQTESQTQSQSARRRRRAQPKQALKIETIDEFMPKTTYSDIFETQLKKKEKVAGDSCSVCLLEFDEQGICRVTPCQHVFHSDCLEQWLKKHENCPICRNELGEKDLRSTPLKPSEEQNLIFNNDDSPTHNQTNLILTAGTRQTNQLRVIPGDLNRQQTPTTVNFERIEE